MIAIEIGLIASTVALTYVTAQSIPNDQKRQGWHFCRKCVKWTYRTIRTKGAHAYRTIRTKGAHAYNLTLWRITTPFRR